MRGRELTGAERGVLLCGLLGKIVESFYIEKTLKKQKNAQCLIVT